MSEKCSCGCEPTDQEEVNIGEYVCYCNRVTERDIINVIIAGAKNVQEVIDMTGAMKNSNYEVNNPKGVCCYPDIVYVFDKYK